MSIVRSLSFVVVAAALSSFAVGCASEPDDSDKVSLTGKVGSASTIAPKIFGGVVVANGNLHVVAHKLHRRGEVGGVVDVAVAADGTFEIDVPKGSRWIVTVDSADQKSAMLSFAGGKSVLDISSSSGVGSVDLGGIDIVGGEAYSSISLEGKAGVAAALAELDEIYEAANGAIASAREAADEARKAADAARAAADQARSDADAARKAAEEAAEKARKAAGG